MIQFAPPFTYIPQAKSKYLNSKKMKKILITAYAAGIIASGSLLQAANLGSANDIFLGFDTTSGTGAYKSVVIDLGSFLNATTTIQGTVIDQSAAGSILSTTFGTNWWTRTDIAYGVFGGNTTTNFVLGTANDTPAFDASPSGSDRFIPNTGRTKESLAFSDVNAQMGSGTTGTITGTKGSFAYGIDAGSGGTAWNANSWGDQFDGDGTALYTGAFRGTYNSLGVTFFDGSSYTSLDVYNYVKNSGNLNWYSGNAMSFNVGITSTGAITVVPEPSTYALFGLGTLALIVVARRRMSMLSK
jgi:hypothetical protein